MESQSLMPNKKLEAFDILKETVKVYTKNINFIILTILTSLPYFCFSVYYETFLQNFLLETSKIFKHTPEYIIFDRPTTFDITTNLNKNFLYQIIQLASLYLVPLHLLELITILVITDLASKIYKEERSSMALKDMIKEPFEGKRLTGSLITLVYVIFLSSCILLGLISLVAMYFVVLRNFENEILCALVFGTTFGLVLRKYLVLSALWNMSLVISILEEGILGFRALALSAHFSKGNERRGYVLMLVFFIWGQSLRLPCLYLGAQQWIVLQISLLCFGNVLKWIACFVYFDDCKNRILEKKVDEEVGKKVESVAG